MLPEMGKIAAEVVNPATAVSFYVLIKFEIKKNDKFKTRASGGRNCQREQVSLRKLQKMNKLQGADVPSARKSSGKKHRGKSL